MGDWDLRLGDCLDPVSGLASLADGSVDHVICDPPYSDRVHSKQRRQGPSGGDIIVTADIGFDAITPEQIEALSGHWSRVCRRWVAVFSDVEIAHLWREALERHGLDFARTCFWHKVGSTPQFTGDRPAVSCEAVTLCHATGRKRWNGGGKHGFYEYTIVKGERCHTTQKPLPLMEALVRDFTDPGELILDPFAGSGTTGVAAIRNGRRFIGWERDPKYHAVATKRLSMAREQLNMLDRLDAQEPSEPPAPTRSKSPRLTITDETGRPLT